ncbi:MAG: trypsin-like peptidase domain-containing protein [Deltaproteobacteria bacterium]|nr:trypsin-like peptidase domain-containing protein [Deltaproteobacteria bacterium]
MKRCDPSAKARSPARMIPVFLVVLFIFTSSLPACPDAEANSSAWRRSPVVEAVERTSPAVVNISTIVREKVEPVFPFSGEDFFRDFFPEFFTREYTHTSLGSGVIIDGRKGYILTNHHVVEKATEIKVITAAKKEFKAKIIGTDPRSDLAVLKIDPAEPLPELKMGNSDDLMIGETVIAIGNPFGLSHTVTTGVVSALDRSVRTGGQVYRHFIQTDASINPGNSGGPLLNILGELIGINTAIYQKAQGIGFAIPINKARRIVRELLRSGEVRFPWLGIEVQDMSPQLKSYFGLEDLASGVLVSDVHAKGPGAEAGIRRGDILLDLEGIPLTSSSSYHDALAEYTPSDRIKITLMRNKKRLEVVVQAMAFPPELALELVYQRLGIEVEEVGTDASKEHRLEGGVMIRSVRRGSEAARIGLKRGDIILGVNDIPTTGLEKFKEAISRYHHSPAVTLLVRRGPYGYSITLPFKPAN